MGSREKLYKKWSRDTQVEMGYKYKCKNRIQCDRFQFGEEVMAEDYKPQKHEFGNTRGSSMGKGP